MFKKVLASIALVSMLLPITGGNFANAANDKERKVTEKVDLEGVDFSQLKPGDVIKLKDTDITITQYTNEEAAKMISEQSGKKEEEVLAELEANDDNTGENTLSAKVEGDVSTMATCATGATAFTRSLNVSSTYKPNLHVWTELCKNSAGQFVVKSIVDITMNRNYNGIVKQFSGKTVAKALNDGKTLYYSADGDFYNKGTTSISGGAGLNTANASVNFSVSNSSNYYKYLHQFDNIILFK